MEEHFFYSDKRGHNLWGFLHMPESNPKELGFVFCHPFVEERVLAYRLMVNFARILCSKGYPIMRFDYYGYGDSDGDFADATVETKIEDILTTAEYFKEKSGVKNVGIIGLRLGSTWGILSSAKNNELSPVIAWEPVINIDNYIKSALRMAITTQTVLFKKVAMNREEIISKIVAGEPAVYEGYRLDVIDGYPITKDFYLQAKDVNLIKSLDGYKGELLVINIVTKEKPINSDQSEFVKKFNESGIKAEIKQAVEPVTFWENTLTHSYHPEKLFDMTIDWISERGK